jgi:glycosyltransferase involved in cell wall biosynthesis
MKIAALIPFRNEEFNLPNCLSSLIGVADFVLGHDDSSSDNSRNVFEDLGGQMIGEHSGLSFSNGDERAIRDLLLTEARKRGATHFLFIDADEVLSDSLRESLRDYCSSLSPGQKILIQWVNLASDENSYFNDQSVFRPLDKDFVIRDHASVFFLSEGGVLHFGRTPNSQSSMPPQIIPPSRGVILHLQHLDEDLYQIKQVRYKCVELIHGTNSAFQINENSAFTLDRSVIISKLPSEFSVRKLVFTSNGIAAIEVQTELIKLFQQYGVKYFEKLEIWHVKVLSEYFVSTVGRPPHSFTASKFFRRIWLKLAVVKRKLLK